jgi:glycosyltransferase involved in cell wall biosynthesis
MRIVNIIPGPIGSALEADSYYGQTLVAELRWAGHDVLLVPVLFPLGNATEDKQLNPENQPIFCSALKLYARHSMRVLSKIVPDYIWRKLDTNFLRNRLGRSVLESKFKFTDFLTDILSGEDGSFTEEINGLTDWLKNQAPAADAILISSPLLLGLVPTLKKKLNIPVFCHMGHHVEDISFLNGTPIPRISSKLRAALDKPDGLLAVSAFQKDRISSRLGIPVNKIQIITPSIELSHDVVNGANEVIVLLHGNTPQAMDSATKFIKQIYGKLSPKQIKLTLLIYTTISNRTDNYQKYKLAIQSLRPLCTSIRKLKSHKEFQSYLQSQASIFAFIHSTPYPAIDMTIIEALSYGKAVIIPTTGACQEISGFSPSILTYDERKPEDLANLIDELCTHKERCRIICEQNAKTVREYFTPSISAKSVITGISKTISQLHPVLQTSYDAEYYLPPPSNSQSSNLNNGPL